MPEFFTVAASECREVVIESGIDHILRYLYTEKAGGTSVQGIAPLEMLLPDHGPGAPIQLVEDLIVPDVDILILLAGHALCRCITRSCPRPSLHADCPPSYSHLHPA